MFFGPGFMWLVAPVAMLMPLLISCFVIKLAVKNAIKDLKNENVL